MLQQGQVFKLKAMGADGEPLWAYRYRLEGRGSERPQVGGFVTRAEAQNALRKALDRIGPGRAGAITLDELVAEYLELHQAEPVTIANLRWLLRKATATLGDKRIADLSPKEVYAWRSTLPEGHRFEATQALRQVSTGRWRGDCSTSIQPSGVFRIRSGGRRRSGRSSPGPRLKRSLPGSDRCMGGW
jgi:hypothetical protein